MKNLSQLEKENYHRVVKRFCWNCGRKFRGNIHAILYLRNYPEKYYFHKKCAKAALDHGYSGFDKECHYET